MSKKVISYREQIETVPTKYRDFVRNSMGKMDDIVAFKDKLKEIERYSERYNKFAAFIEKVDNDISIFNDRLMKLYTFFYHKNDLEEFINTTDTIIESRINRLIDKYGKHNKNYMISRLIEKGEMDEAYSLTVKHYEHQMTPYDKVMEKMISKQISMSRDAMRMKHAEKLFIEHESRVQQAYLQMQNNLDFPDGITSSYGGIELKSFIETLSFDDLNMDQVFKLDKGRSQPLRITTDSGQRVIAKKHDAMGVDVDHEVAAYVLDSELFGLGKVVPAKSMNINGEPYVVSAWIDNTADFEALGSECKCSAEVNVLNFIYGNTDGTDENVLGVLNHNLKVVDDIAIDFSQGFPMFGDGIENLPKMVKDIIANPEKYTPDNKQFIQMIHYFANAKEGQYIFRQKVKELLSGKADLTNNQIDGMYERIKFLSQQYEVSR